MSEILTSTSDKLREIVHECTGVAPKDFKPSSRIVDDLGLDSLDVVEFVMMVEEEWGIDVPDEEVERFVTVEDWVKHIDSFSD